MRTFLAGAGLLLGIFIMLQPAPAAPPPDRTPAKPHTAARLTARASNEFAVDLLRELTQGRNDGNIVFSPWSVTAPWP